MNVISYSLAIVAMALCAGCGANPPYERDIRLVSAAD